MLKIKKNKRKSVKKSFFNISSQEKIKFSAVFTVFLILILLNGFFLAKNYILADCATPGDCQNDYNSKFSGDWLIAQEWRNLDNDFINQGGDTMNGRYDITSGVCVGANCGVNAQNPVPDTDGPVLEFGNGSNHNSDPLRMWRYDRSPDRSELRMLIGDNYGFQDDKFAIGAWDDTFANDGDPTNDHLKFDFYSIFEVHSNGDIFRMGGQIHPDYVFEPDYNLESIEEHTHYMFSNKHLKAVPKGKYDKKGRPVVNMGEREHGMLEELEKAHVYISQLNERIKKLEEKMEN